MATQAQISSFIALVAPLIQKYAQKYGYKVASPIIAQACCESAYGTSTLWSKYFNGFGLKCGSAWKGKSVNMTTKEEYTVGTLTTIKDNFRVYDSAEEGVEGYFKFISATRYANLLTATTAEEYLKMIKVDGYATSSTYVNTNLAIVQKYNLTQYDNFESKREFNLSKESYRNLQTILNSLGFKGANGKVLTVDGVFGTNSKKALKDFCEWYIKEES